MKLLVSGASGQLGMCLKDVTDDSETFADFLDKTLLDITNLDDCISAIKRYSPDIWLNCAAYTAVDRAESDKDMAYLINTTGIENIAKACSESNIPVIHISTDYVYDGLARSPYTEEVMPDPESVYGMSKLDGENILRELLPNSVIIRTSWLYSEYNQNFVKTMLRLADTHHEISVVNDQTGSPTYARDLAKCMLSIAKSMIKNEAHYRGVYNFANTGKCTWYEFSKAIFSIARKLDVIDKAPKVIPVSSNEYKTVAKRPTYSVLDSSKILSNYGVNNRNWSVALEEMLQRLKAVLEKSI